jgi:hypothetical protein
MKSSCCGKMHKPFFNSVPRRSVVFKRFKRWTMLLVILAVTALFAMVGTTIAAQKEATPKAQYNVAVGEPEVKQMSLLPALDGRLSTTDTDLAQHGPFEKKPIRFPKRHHP